MRTTTFALTAALLLGSAACKKKNEEKPAATPTAEAPAAPSAPAAPAPAADPHGLAPGEEIWTGTRAAAGADGGAADKTAGRVVEWAPKGRAAGQPVTLYVVRTGDDRGVLRARHGESRQDLESFTLQKGETPDVDLQTLPGGGALFRYSPRAGASEQNQRVALLLAWDEQEGKVNVVKRWRGSKTQSEPRWMQTGQLTAEPSALAKCQQVVQKISRCAKEPKFIEALFHKQTGSDRESAEKQLAEVTPRWAKPAAARKQCEEWAGSGYVDTQFSDPDELDQLVKDTKLDCAFFGREIEDEGGLPQPMAVAKAAR